MGLLNLFRIVCYVILVGPQSGLARMPIDPDAFPSGCLRLARWGCLLQDYTTLSTSQNTTPSTAALTFTVRDLQSSSLLWSDSDTG